VLRIARLASLAALAGDSGRRSQGGIHGTIFSHESGRHEASRSDR
jgi:hypothetical protein